MAYKLEDANWPFRVPQRGEVDAADVYANAFKDVSGVNLTQEQKGKLLSEGSNQNIVVGEMLDDTGVYAPISVNLEVDDTFALDAYLHQRLVDGKEGGKDVFVTSLHTHPTQEWVPNSDKATKADSLTTGFNITIEGADPEVVHADGKTDITLDAAAKNHTHTAADIKDMFGSYGGIVPPDEYQGFPEQIVHGSIYVEYFD